MATIPLTISGIKEAKKDLKELDAEFQKFKQDPIKSAKLAKHQILLQAASTILAQANQRPNMALSLLR